MTQVWAFLAAHQTLSVMGAYFAFAAFVGGMPAPTASSGVAYRWAFSSLNILAANIARARNTTIENSPNWQAALQKASDAVKP